VKLWLTLFVLLAACEDGSRARKAPPNAVRIVYAVDTTDEAAVDQAVRVIRTRLDDLGLRGATVQRRGLDIVVELPEADGPARDVLPRTAKLEFTMVDEDAEYMRRLFKWVRDDPEAARLGVEADIDGWRVDPTNYNDYFLVGDRVAIEQYLQALVARDPSYAVPADRRLGYEMFTAAKWRTYLLEQTAPITGEQIERARVTRNAQTDRPEVLIELDRDGAQRFADMTGANVGHKLAILLDGRVTSAPVIQSRIAGGKSTITMGGGTADEQQREAEALVAVLSSGSLPAALLEQSFEQIR